jgi:plastocyanin
MNLDRRTLLLTGAAAALIYPAAGRAAATVKVSIPEDNSIFEPAEVHVKVGDSVEWTNLSLIEHTVTCDPAKVREAKNVALPSGASVFDSGEFGTDQTFLHQFTSPGRYRYFCVLHEDMGMVGEVIVTA